MRNNVHGCGSPYLQSNSKRILDIILVVISFLPFLLLVVISGLILLVTEGRPIFFVHKRVGLYGKFIDIIKLRTLKNDIHPYLLSPNNESRRVLRYGKFLRRSKFDEIPQLISVIRGQMSFVGPRPELATLTANYKKSHYAYRLNAKPGITGLWQIKADTSRPIYENIKYDLYYVRNASLMLDLKLVALTVVFMLRNKDV